MRIILSIDGGGIRGIIPGMVLIDLEERIQRHAGNPDARLADYFDFFAGTSTGGVLTSLLLCGNGDGRPRYTAAEAVGLYLHHGREIFRSWFPVRILSRFGLVTEKYNARSLMDVFDSYFRDTRLSDLLKPCLITAYNTELRKAHFFRQHGARQKGKSKDFYVKDACRATCAAPGYFRPAEVYSLSGTRYPLIDGGIFANNPTLAAILEVISVRRTTDPSDLIILSLGTGVSTRSYEYNFLRNIQAIRAVPALIDMMFSGMSETTDFIIRQLFKISNHSSHYLRINPQNLNSIDEATDNASLLNINKLKSLGERMASEYGEQLDTFASMVVAARRQGHDLAKP
jgi:hypothetical protein